MPSLPGTSEQEVTGFRLVAGGCLADRPEERLPHVSSEAERSAVAVGGVAHEDHSTVGSCLYARSAVGA
jgi:hypothetical protein